MNKKQDGGPAFPCDTIVNRDDKGRLQGHEISSTGLSVRDYFAGLAMQGVLSGPAGREILNGPTGGSSSLHAAAGLAYEIADAMLIARDAA